MTDLRKEARGRQCQVRYINVCNHDPTTTVLAHLRMAGISGVAQKAPDALGAFACSACHDEADRRTHKLALSAAQLAFYEGIFRTQNILIREGKIKW